MKSSIRISSTVLSLCIAMTLLANARAKDPPAEQAKASKGNGAPETRTFRFKYEAAINELDPGTVARVWVPIASSNADQDVEVTAIKTPTQPKRTKERRFGNELVYFEAIADEKGEIPL